MNLKLLAFAPFALSLSFLYACGMLSDTMQSNSAEGNADSKYLAEAWATLTGGQAPARATTSPAEPPPDAQEYGAQGTVTSEESARVRYYAFPQSTKAIHSLLGSPAKYTRDADYYRMNGGWAVIHYDSNGNAYRVTNPPRRAAAAPPAAAEPAPAAVATPAQPAPAPVEAPLSVPQQPPPAETLYPMPGDVYKPSPYHMDP